MNFSNIMACTLIDNVAKIIDTSQYVTHMHHLAETKTHVRHEANTIFTHIVDV